MYEPELVHDIIDDMEERYDDEDDSNGRGKGSDWGSWVALLGLGKVVHWKK